MNTDLRPLIKAWAESHLTQEEQFTVYPMWEKTWCLASPHLNIKLQLWGNDIGADIVIKACAGGYGGDETDWSGVNLGWVTSVGQLDLIYGFLTLWAENHQELG